MSASDEGSGAEADSFSASDEQLEDSVLRHVASEELDIATRLFMQMRREGNPAALEVAVPLVTALAKGRLFGSAERVLSDLGRAEAFARSPAHTSCRGALIASYCGAGRYSDAFAALTSLQEARAPLAIEPFRLVAQGLAKERLFDDALRVVFSGARVPNAQLDAKLFGPTMAQLVEVKPSDRDWKRDALALLTRARKAGAANDFLFSLGLRACIESGAEHEALGLLREMRRENVAEGPRTSALRKALPQPRGEGRDRTRDRSRSREREREHARE